jgi:hypothetical protein
MLDVSRLRLGHPPLRERGKLQSPRVAEIYVREAASPSYHVMRELCLRLWIDMDACDRALCTRSCPEVTYSALAVLLAAARDRRRRSGWDEDIGE